MTIEELAMCYILSSHIGNIIIEKYIAKESPPDIAYVINNTHWKKEQILFIKKYESDFFVIENDEIKVIADEQLLARSAKKHIMFAIKQNVYASKYAEKTFINNIGKLLDNKYYKRYELDFIDEVYNIFAEISNIETDVGKNSLTFPSDKDLMRYQSINYHYFKNIARKIFNETIQGRLHAGDDIGGYIKPWKEKNREYFKTLLLYSHFYEWFFEPVGGKLTLRCDLDTNRDLFIVSFINIVIYCFDDLAVQGKFLKQLHAKFGLIRRDFVDVI